MAVEPQTSPAAQASLLKGIVFRNVEFGKFTGWRDFLNTVLWASWSFPFGKAPQMLFLELFCAQLVPRDARNGGPQPRRRERCWEGDACGVACADGVCKAGVERW